MIPKKIHYCWFGGKPIPKEYQKYIATWHKFLPDYELIQWNETNFDINASEYTRKAYADGKMAFVSDYARLKILYEYGGVYFDTDVEVIDRLDDIIANGPFMGFEKNTFANAGDLLNVNLGLGFAVDAYNPIIKDVLNYYDSHVEDKRLTIVVIVTDILKKYGLVESDKPVVIEDITIYPWDYFCPVEFLSSKLEITANTRTIHHFSASWMTWFDKLKMKKGYYASKVRKLLGIRRK